MTRRIDAVPDHVAVVVPDFDVADRRWRDELGGRWVAWYHAHGAFRSRQLRFRGDAKLELLMPSDVDPSPDNFVRRYLDRFGAQVHHLTLRVPDLPAAIEVLEADGLDVVDVDLSGDTWKESFLRPSQVGGMIVQVAWSGQTDLQWAAAHGYVPEEPPSGGAVLRGPLLEHPDLDHAAWLWELLGADVDHDGEDLVAHWDGAPLEVRVREAPTAGPVGLLFDGAEARPRDPELGAAVLPG